LLKQLQNKIGLFLATENQLLGGYSNEENVSMNFNKVLVKKRRNKRKKLFLNTECSSAIE